MSGLRVELVLFVISFAIVATLKVTNKALYEVSFELGNEEELILLYSYPNSEKSNQTLRETVEHYLTQVVERDLIENGLVDVSVSVARNVPISVETGSGQPGHPGHVLSGSDPLHETIRV